MKKSIFHILLMSIISFAQAKELANITVHAGTVSRDSTWVHCSLENAHFIERPLVLTDASKQIRLPVQIDKTTPDKIWFQLPVAFPAGHSQTFVLTESESPPPMEMTLEDDGDGLLIKTLGQHVLRYNYKPFPIENSAGEKELPAYRKRSGYIHPVWSPGGRMLTEIHPASHKHQLGLWSAWTRTTYQGEKFDFWNIKKKDALEMVQFIDFAAIQDGPYFASFIANHEYLLKGMPVMDETLEIRAFQSDGSFFFDYTVTQAWLKDEPLILEQHTYGGPIAWRYPSWWTDESVTVVTSEGKTQRIGESSADATHARWFKLHGQHAGQKAGIVIMSHPSNVRHPEPLRIMTNAKAGGYVHFSPIKKQSWKLERGKQLKHHFRVCIHDDSIPAELAEKWWQQFASPPEVTITIN